MGVGQTVQRDRQAGRSYCNSKCMRSTCAHCTAPVAFSSPYADTASSYSVWQIYEVEIDGESKTVSIQIMLEVATDGPCWFAGSS